MLKTFIIAEAGVNHNGDINIAYELIDIAKEAGADAIKFQTWKTENLITKTAEKTEYQKKNTTVNETQFEMIKKLELQNEEFIKLKKYCDMKNIIFMSTCAEIESLNFLLSIGMKKIKIGSPDITNLPFLKYISSLNKDVFLSTGMANMEEIKSAVKVLKSNGLNDKKITILHCNSEYPTPYEDTNLSSIIFLKKKLNLRVGYSDHTLGPHMPVAAVAMGAEVIEKHFTLNKNMNGPDHSSSLNPKELKEMIKFIRDVDKAFGREEIFVTKSEYKNISLVRKSIVASKKINKGEYFSENNITIKRPGNGISPMKWYTIIGLVASKSFEKDEIIKI